MIKYYLAVILLFQFCVFGAEKHQHGVGHVNIVYDKSKLYLQIESPSDNFLGFEHQPRTAEEKKQVEELLEILSEPANIVELPENTSCKITKKEIETPFESFESHEDEEPHEDEEDEGHSDFVIEYRFSCDSPPASLSFKPLFDAFKGFEEVEVSWLVNKRQGAQEITPKHHRVTF